MNSTDHSKFNDIFGDEPQTGDDVSPEAARRASQMKPTPTVTVTSYDTELGYITETVPESDVDGPQGYNAPARVSVRQAAASAGVSEQTILDTLNDETRRNEVFPTAEHITEDRWVLSMKEVVEYGLNKNS